MYITVLAILWCFSDTITSTSVCVCVAIRIILSQFIFAGFRPAIACLERLKDNPTCSPVRLPEDYYQCLDAFRGK